MIKANELMIGNIFWESYGGYGVVTAININNKGIFPDTILGRGIKGTLSGQFGCEDITPIHLAPEILEKCGFENKRIKGFNDADGSWWLLPGEFKFRFLFEFDKQKGSFFNGFLGMEVKYIHQLQNLYFALVGKELEIKL